MTDNLPLRPDQVFAVIGTAGFTRLVAAFYRHIETDTLLRPMYPPGNLKPAEDHLRLFLEQYFGGPTTYSHQRGHPRLRMRHARFHIDMAARNRWVELMQAALDEAGLPTEVNAILNDYFENAATFLINAAPPLQPD